MIEFVFAGESKTVPERDGLFGNPIMEKLPAIRPDLA